MLSAQNKRFLDVAAAAEKTGLAKELDKHYMRLIAAVGAGAAIMPALPIKAAQDFTTFMAISDMAGRANMIRDAARTLVKSKNTEVASVLKATDGFKDIQVAVEISMKLPPAAAIENFGKRVGLLAKTRQEVAAVYAGEGGFTAIRITEQTMLDHVKSRLQTFIEQGGAEGGIEGFPKGFAEWMHEQDPEKFSESYSALVFRNNCNTAMHEGRWSEMQELKDEFTGWEYFAVLDDATREEHAELNGMVFPMDWKRLIPPIAHNCRCSFAPTDSDEPMSHEEADSIADDVFAATDAWDFDK